MGVKKNASMTDFARFLVDAEQRPELKNKGWELLLAQRRQGGFCLRHREKDREYHIAHFGGPSSLSWPFLSESRPAILLKHDDVIRAWGLDSATVDIDDLVSRKDDPLEKGGGVFWNKCDIRPDSGNEIKNDKLLGAVRTNQWCSWKEFEDVGLGSIKSGDYVGFNGEYWIPILQRDENKDNDAEADRMGDFVLKIIKNIDICTN